MKIKGLGVFGIKVNDTPLNQALNVFEQVQIQCGYGMSFPVMRLVVRDQHNIFVGSLALVDGTKISVTFGKDAEESDTYTFCVFSSDITHDSQPGSIFTVYAVLAVPELLYGALFFKHDGTSTSALSKLFDESDFPYQAVHESDDSQLWTSCGGSALSFINDTTLHSYSNDQSCFYTAIDFDQATTVDIFKQLEKEAQLDVYYNAPVESSKPYLVTSEIKPESRSSLLNSMSNYGHSHYQHSLGGQPLKLDKISPNLSESLPINADIKSKLQMAALTYGSGFDSGSGEGIVSNVHANYYKARYQNLRYLGLMSQGVRFSNRSYVNLPLFCVPNIHHGAILGKAERDDAIAGKYLVVGKTITLVGTQFLEVYDAARFFLTETGNTRTVASSASAIPTEDFNSSQDTPATNLTHTGNKAPSVVQSVLDKELILETQINPVLPQDPASVFDKLVSDLNEVLDTVENNIQANAEAWSFPELAKKYGVPSDMLENITRELLSAANKLDACKPLTSLESLTVQISFAKTDQLMKALHDRQGALNTALGRMETMVNDFLEKAEIDISSTDYQSPETDCSMLRDKLASAAVQDKLQDACTFNRDIAKINVPVLKLSRKLSQFSADFEKTICLLGH
tara:strand:- start:6738 stop:8618 length:1881 start_codon:yes stop_codon:yes gene_type:complete